MKISKLIEELQELMKKHGDIEVTTGDTTRKIDSAYFTKDDLGIPVIDLVIS